MSDILKIEDLVIQYDTDSGCVHALNGLSLTLREGETLGLVGETGAGKTTTALSILRLLPETTGRIKGGEICFEGEDLLHVDEEQMRGVRGNRISMVFQDPMSSLNPVYTVGDQIGEAIRLHRPELSNDAVEQRIDEILQLVGIMPSRKHEYPHQFSGGMKQRVVIAMALCCEPELLIADEPTTALDVTIQEQILQLIRELNEKLGMSVLFITHDMGAVANLCHNVKVMYLGQVVEEASTEELFQKIEKKGVKVANVTLHVGLGTFRPVKVDDVTKHHMHTEFYRVDKEAADLMNETKKNGGRIICVGTTSCRTIESAADEQGVIHPGQGDTSIFIYPGYKFKMLDALITNFHLPESTLLMLVSALAGKDQIMNAYETAVKEKYRFFSFGDAMIILDD